MAKRRKSNSNFFVTFIFILFMCFVIYLLYNFDNKSINNNKEKTSVTSNNDSNKNEKTNDVKEEKTDSNKEKQEELIPSEEIPDEKINQNSQNYNKNVDVDRIELIGEERVTIKQGENYNDPGAKAYDSNNKDISYNIKVDSNLDTTKKGEYSITYSIGNYIVIRFIVVE